MCIVEYKGYSNPSLIFEMKTDTTLGNQVRQHLIDMGVETPTRKLHSSPTKRKVQIANHFRHIMQLLGLDLEDDSLVESPRRVAEMYVEEAFYGMSYANFPKLTVVDNKIKYDHAIVERHIVVQSTCEHHFVPICGHAHVAYLPSKKVAGLSKFNRIVDFFCRRPQIQERLTEQLWHTFSMLLETQDVAVIIAAEHFCVKTRGVKDPCSDTVTSKLGGIFRETAARQELFSMISLPSK